jgi:hypothetical protein
MHRTNVYLYASPQSSEHILINLTRVAQGMLKQLNFVYLQYSVEKCYILHNHFTQPL